MWCRVPVPHCASLVESHDVVLLETLILKGRDSVISFRSKDRGMLVVDGALQGSRERD